MKRIRCAVVAAVLVLAGGGCREEGPAERAGRAIDDAAREVGDQVRDLTGEEGALERAGRKADEALEKMKKAIEER
ncbi:MAG TPA: hypothetical protein VKH41_09560 [Myxococcota bacterium]|nr:hypothetical protein [Myxococcota bacterium]